VVDIRGFRAEPVAAAGGVGRGGVMPQKAVRPDYSSALKTSPPWAVLSARHTGMLIDSRTKRRLPSHRATLTPPGCRLRAPISRGRAGVDVVVHGIRGDVSGSQMPPVMTSCSVLLGLMYAVKPAAPPHQVKPRRSLPRPWIASDATIVLLVPSVTSAIRAGRPIRPRAGSVGGLVHGNGESQLRSELAYQPNGAPRNGVHPGVPGTHPSG